MRFRIKKSDVNNKGIKFRFYIEKDCYLIPYMESVSYPFYRTSRAPYTKVEYEITAKKVFFWFWFRVSITLEGVSPKIVPDFPLVEKLIMMLPPQINVVEKTYKLNMSRENKFKISYTCGEEFLFGEVSSFNFKETLQNAVNSIKDSDNVRFLRSDYKTLYEQYFNIDVPQERKFEPYYE